jgi:hypothetical protein
MIWLSLLLAATPAYAEEPGVLVQLWTISPTPALDGAWGHTMLRVKVDDPPSDRIYDFGRYETSTTFVTDLLSGELSFQLVAKTTGPIATWLGENHRGIISRDILLPPETAKALRARLKQRLEPDKRTFTYDPVFANCVTQVRDLFDEVVFQGAWSAAAKATPGEALRVGNDRMLAGSPGYRWLIEGAYGPLTHQPQSQWDATFLPYQLDAALDAIGRGDGPVVAPAGVTIGPATLYQDTGLPTEPPRSMLTSWPAAVWALLMLALAPSLAAPHHAASRALRVLSAGVWTLLGGCLGTAVALLQLQPSPIYHGNLTVLALHPFLWLTPWWLYAASRPPSAPAGWFTGPRANQLAMGAAITCAMFAVVAALVMVPYGQPLPAHLPPIAALQLMWLAVVRRVRSA